MKKNTYLIFSLLQLFVVLVAAMQLIRHLAFGDDPHMNLWVTTALLIVAAANGILNFREYQKLKGK